MTNYKEIQRANKLAWKRSRAGTPPKIKEDQNGKAIAVFSDGSMYFIYDGGSFRKVKECQIVRRKLDGDNN